jgi:hypothetical protein
MKPSESGIRKSVRSTSSISISSSLKAARIMNPAPEKKAPTAEALEGNPTLGDHERIFTSTVTTPGGTEHEYT